MEVHRLNFFILEYINSIGSIRERFSDIFARVYIYIYMYKRACKHVKLSSPLLHPSKVVHVIEASSSSTLHRLAAVGKGKSLCVSRNTASVVSPCELPNSKNIRVYFVVYFCFLIGSYISEVRSIVLI